jgi:hypothetical protein
MRSMSFGVVLLAILANGCASISGLGDYQEGPSGASEAAISGSDASTGGMDSSPGEDVGRRRRGGRTQRRQPDRRRGHPGRCRPRRPAMWPHRTLREPALLQQRPMRRRFVGQHLRHGRRVQGLHEHRRRLHQRRVHDPRRRRRACPDVQCQELRRLHALRRQGLLQVGHDLRMHLDLDERPLQLKLQA